MNQEIQDYGRRRRYLRWNTFGALLLAGLLTLMVNYLGQRYWWRHDFSRAAYYTLAQASRDLLHNVPGAVRLTALMAPDHELYRDLRGLLQEYEHADPNVQVEIVDPHRDLARAKELALKYDTAESDQLIVAANGRTIAIPIREMADYDFTPLMAGRPRRLQAFLGEQAISSAIHSLLQPRRPVVGFLTGHGEKSIEDHDTAHGYATIARLIRRGNIDVRQIHFDDQTRPVELCDALVIAGPARRLSSSVIDILRGYLNEAGRLFVLLDHGTDTGLNALLEEWGVRVGNDRVIGLTLTGRELLVVDYGDHPVTARMRNITTIFNMPRSVQPAIADTAADRPRVTVLAATGDQGWADMSAFQDPPRFDPKTDRRGPISVAVAVEKGIAEGIEVELRPSRMVVFGDSTLVSNGALNAGYNSDLFVHALNWLLEIGKPLPIAPKEPPSLRVFMSRRRLNMLYGILCGILPAAMLMIGAIVWWNRRK